MPVFPDQHGAAILQPFDRGGVVIGNVVFKDFRAGGGADALSAEEILHGDRNAVERAAAFAAREFLIGLARAVAGGFGHDELERVRGRIEPFNLFERSGGEFGGGYFAAAQCSGGFENGHASSSSMARLEGGSGIIGGGQHAYERAKAGFERFQRAGDAFQAGVRHGQTASASDLLPVFRYCHRHYLPPCGRPNALRQERSWPKQMPR